MSKLSRGCRAVAVLAVSQVLTIGAIGCQGARESAGLVLELEGRYPGSQIEVRDLNEAGSRRIEVTIKAGSFGDRDLDEEAREVAASVRERFDLRADRDTVAVAFEADRQMGVLSTHKSAQFIYPVSKLAGSD